MLESFLQHVWEVSFAGVLILFGAWYFVCARKILSVNAAIKTALAAEDIAAALKGSPLLAPAWRSFEQTLTRTSETVYSTIDAAEFFSERTLTRGMNMSFWQAYGGIFTGLGILGTFAGLTFGLSGVDMTSGDIDVLKDGIKNLLSGVESAFVTSLVGIFFGLVYSVAHHKLIVALHDKIAQLTDALDEKFPRRSAEDWLSKNFSEAQVQTTTLQNIDTESKEQTSALKNIGEDVARALYEGLDERMDDAIENLCAKLEEKLLPQTDKICGSIEKLDGDIATSTDKICAAIDKLGAGAAEGLSDTMSKVAGAQMDRFSAALDRFSDSIDAKLKTADEIAKLMNEQLLTTLQELREALRQQAQDSAAERAEAQEKFLATLDGLLATLNTVADNIKAQQDASAAEFATLLKTSLDNFSATMAQVLANAQKSTDDTNGKFTSTLEGLLATLNTVADNIKAQQDASAAEFATLLKTSLDNFSATMAQVLAKFKLDTDTANKGTRDANEQFLATLAALSKTLQEVADKINRQQTTAGNKFETLVANLIAQLNSFIDAQKKFFNNVANSNATEISRAVAAFREIVDRHNAATKKTFADIQTLLNESETYLQGVADAGNSLSQAAEPVKQSTAQLTRNLSETAAQMNTLSDANRTTRENLAALSERLATFTKNFNGIANELERSTTVITNSLDNYNGKISDGLTNALTQFDKTVSNALGGLNELIEDLKDALDDFNRKRRW